ncbi:hypothetical protein ACFQ5Q_18710 [Luteolibacter ambystomatis]
MNETIRYATCNHCGSNLEIIHDPSVTHTRILEKLERTTDTLADDVKILQLQNDLQLLDREWERYRETVCFRSENGTLSEPSAAFPAVVRGVTIGGGIILCMAVWLGNLPWGMALLGIAVPILGNYAAHSYAGGLRDYRRAKERYQSRRYGLVAAIASLRGSPEPPRKRPAFPARIRIPFMRSGRVES